MVIINSFATSYINVIVTLSYQKQKTSFKGSSYFILKTKQLFFERKMRFKSLVNPAAVLVKKLKPIIR